jgi:hypothetical protein
MDGLMDDPIWSIERNDTDIGKAKYSEENVFQCHFVLHKSHMILLVSNPGLHGERSCSLMVESVDAV